MRFHQCVCLLILCAVFIPVCVSGASFSVDQISVVGAEQGYFGDSIQVSARVSFDAAGEVTFPGQDTLQLSTDLIKPVWRYTLFIDNNPVQTFSRESGVVFINGYYLEYAQGRSEYLTVEVTGMIPEGGDGEGIDALTVTQYDAYGNIRGDGVSTVPVVVHTGDESVHPELSYVPESSDASESAPPVPTQSPLSGFISMAGIVCALAVVAAGKNEC